VKRRRLFTQIYVPHVAVLLLALLMAGGWALREARREQYEQTRRSPQAAAAMLADTLGTAFAAQSGDATQRLCQRLGSVTGYRFTVILDNGQVLGDSLEDPRKMDNHAARPEILQLIAPRSEDSGWAVRVSSTVRLNMMYVAVPWEGTDGRIGFVRAARALDDIDRAVAGQRARILGAGLWLALLGAFVSVLIARRVSRPLVAMRQRVEAFTVGEDELHLPSSSVREIDALTETMNVMAIHLNERIQTIVRQRDEQNALFSCMTEAVVAVDDQGCILSMNRAAIRLFRPGRDEVVGRPIQEVVRNADLQRLWRHTLKSAEPVEEEVAIPDTDRCLQAHGAVLTDGHGHRIGAVLVMNDITRLRRLETMRRDFVANVSHELKTPVTSIKGFAETLLDGAAEQPEDRMRFLAIIDKQADRLKSILEDLLALSSLEHDAENGAVVFHCARIAPLLEHAAQAWAAEAAAKEMTCETSCDAELRAVVNAPLLEQALVNLVGNAVKYGLPRTVVSVSAASGDGGIVLRVADQGPGIARHHLPRLFERFYRVDKGRSRTMGGTGLGLAIVKRVAIAHGGRAEVESQIGQGSVFRLHLPEKPDTPPVSGC